MCTFKVVFFTILLLLPLGNCKPYPAPHRVGSAQQDQDREGAPQRLLQRKDELPGEYKLQRSFDGRNGNQYELLTQI